MNRPKTLIITYKSGRKERITFDTANKAAAAKVKLVDGGSVDRVDIV